MPNATRLRTSPTPSEMVQRSFLHPGTDSLAVRIVKGQVTYGTAAYGQERPKSTAGAADEAAVPVDAPVIGDLLAGEAPMLFIGARNFSSVRLYVRFLDGAVPVGFSNASDADVTAYHINDNGEVVKGNTFSSIRHHVEVVDDGVVGRPTFYRITGVAFVNDGGGDPDSVVFRAAGEGLGYRE